MSDKPAVPVKRRFIAGAVCPRCGEMDKIVNYRLDDKNYRECVACGFKDELRVNAPPREVSTRVTEKEQESAVTILQSPPQPPKKK